MKTIKVPVWWTHNGMMTKRDCLPINHPEHTYNYMKDKMNVVPEEYGVFHPLQEKYKTMSREELIMKTIELENELEGVLRYV